MKWFKHLTASKSNNDIMESEIKFKSQGPYVFWRVLEILASEDAVDKPLTMNMKVFKMWFPSVTCTKLNIILTYFQHKNRIIFKISDGKIIISCPKLTEISSDYSSKVRSHLKVSSKRVRKMSVTDIDLEKENKNKKKKKDRDENIFNCNSCLTEYLLTRVLEKRQIKVTSSKLKTWCNTFKKIRKSDNRSTFDIYLMIKECHDMIPQNGFSWADNILSPDSLRKRWDEGKIYIGMNKIKKVNGYNQKLDTQEIINKTMSINLED